MRRERWRALRLIEAATVGVFTLYVAWPFLRPDRYVTVFDTATYGGPNAEYTRSQLLDGRIPEWNDLIFGGAPHLANPQAAVLYPVRLLLVAVESHRALSLLAAFHLVLLAAGLVVLLSLRLRLRPPAAAVGAIAVVGSALLMARAVQTEQLAVIAWIPWVLAGIDWILARTRRPTLPVAATAIATGLLLVAGHPQQVYLALPFVAVWTVARAADRSAWRRLVPVALAGLLGLGLATAQLLPTALLLDQVVTGDRDLTDVAESSHIVPSNIGAVFLGDATSDRPDVVAGSFEAMAAVGSVAVALAVFGAVQAVRRRPQRWTAVGMVLAGAAATVLAVGPAWPPFRWAFHLVPGFDQQRVPARWLLVAVLAVAMLAGFAVDALVRRRFDRADLVIGGGAVGLLTIGFLAGTDTPSGAASTIWLLGAVVVVAAAAVSVFGPPSPRLTAAVALVPAVLVVLEVGAMQRHSIARSSLEEIAVTERSGPAAEFLADDGGRTVVLTSDPFGDWPALVPQLRPNANALFDVRSLDGYDGGLLLTEPWAEGMNAVSERSFTTDFPLSEQLAQPLDAEGLADLGVRWVLIDGGSYDIGEVAPDWTGPVVVDGTLQVWENPAYESDALVLSDCDDHPRRAGSTDCETEAVSLARPRPGRVGATVTVDEPSVLAVAEQYADGWSATVDGERATVFPVDDFRIGVEVPEGEHRVRLEYRTPGLRLGLLISAASMLVVLVLVAIAFAQWRWNPRSRASVTDPTQERTLRVGDAARAG